jgi:hypothetical protein
MTKSIKDWLNEGEELYGQAMEEFHALEAQLEELEAKLAAKQDEVNQLAAIIGRQPVELNHRKPTVQIVEGHAPGSIPASRNTIAKALTGRGLG